MTDNRPKGGPGYYGTTSGIPPVLGAGEAAPAYTPPATLEQPADVPRRLAEMSDGSTELYGTPLFHSTQQLYAYQHGRHILSELGVDAVTFPVVWSWMPETLFTVSHTGWVQAEPETGGF